MTFSKKLYASLVVIFVSSPALAKTAPQSGFSFGDLEAAQASKANADVLSIMGAMPGHEVGDAKVLNPTLEDFKTLMPTLEDFKTLLPTLGEEELLN